MSQLDRREGFVTSYAGLFIEHPERPVVTQVRIPLVQRDYAQGRPDQRAAEIRGSFLDALHAAVSGGQLIGLDFIYGDIDEEGALLPLDGQQRLTTLFLLHWFLCLRAGEQPSSQGWSRFSYDTRASARRFCERVVLHPPPRDEVGLAEWIVDQAWFLHGWRNDPTIRSMLTMIGAIEARFAGTDAASAWSRLTDPEEPAISFLLLPIEEIGAGDELYIKMNSRGKPLTPFENFKARLEQTLAWCGTRADELAHKIDGLWSDLLWPMRGDDDVVDDEFMRLLELVIEVCEWREDRVVGGFLHQRAKVVFGPDNPKSEEHLSFLFRTFDVWSGYDDVTSTFHRMFTTEHRSAQAGEAQSVVLFGVDVQPDLFTDCGRTYGELRGNARVFSLAQTLLLYAVLLHRIHASPDFSRRLRVLRNLLAASVDEVRRENMPKLVADTEALVLAASVGDGLAALTTFTRALVAGEQEKLSFLDEWPDLSPVVWRLEDHPLLRGSLSPFELDPTSLEDHSEGFRDLFDYPSHWPELTGALLAADDYQRRRPNSEGWQFGSGSAANDAVWRGLFTGARADVSPTRAALTFLLNAFGGSGRDAESFLDEFTESWLQRRAAGEHLDWRYYLVRYPRMREGASGIYFGSNGVLGYSLCMLRKTQLNSNYRDPFLLAILEQSGSQKDVKDPWFTGYPSAPRWMELRRSSTGLRCVESGIELNAPQLAEHRAVFDELCARSSDVVTGTDGCRMPVEQRALPDGTVVDVEDRVAKGAAVLNRLVEAGL